MCVGVSVWLVWSGIRIAGCSLQHGHQISKTQRTENTTTDVVIQQQNRKLLKMDILMSETCWAHKKWNKIASDIKLVFYSSTIRMMHGPINTRYWVWCCHSLMQQSNAQSFHHQLLEEPFYISMQYTENVSTTYPGCLEGVKRLVDVYNVTSVWKCQYVWPKHVAVLYKKYKNTPKNLTFRWPCIMINSYN